LELLYHVRPDDSVVGSIERERAHSEKILHRAGMVFLDRTDGKILLQHRSPLKTIFPDCFDSSCAFHVTFRETYEHAAARELEEEIGISALLSFLGKFFHSDPPENQIVAVFAARSDQQVRIDEKEASGAAYYEPEEVDRIVAVQRTTPWLRAGWKLARDQIAGVNAA
jgi:isopentenyl-diphosphate delta-isomerase